VPGPEDPGVLQAVPRFSKEIEKPNPREIPKIVAWVDRRGTIHEIFNRGSDNSGSRVEERAT
jgi:hypothetical protein